MARLTLSSLIALSVLVFAKIPVWGVVTLEEHFGVFPVVSQETVESMPALTAAHAKFDRACYCYKSGAGASLNGESCEGIANESVLDQAVASRKAAASKLDPSLLTAVALGVNYHTHSTWTC